MIQTYRATKDKGDKIKIPCFTASGTFTKRAIDGLDEYNGVICLDIDGKDNPNIDMDELKQKLSTLPFILAAHYSVGGAGLAVYIATDNKDARFHSFICEDYMNQFEANLHVVCDKCCKDVSRLRFISYDRDMFLNDTPTIVPVNTGKYEFRKEANYSARDVGSAISGTHPIIRLAQKIMDNGIDITSDYHDWVKIAFSLSDAIGESGRNVFHGLSSMNSKYNFTESDKLFTKAMSRNSSQRVTEKTFYKIASDYGVMLKEN